MAAAVESLDSFRTPNLFEASITADSSQFDGYFVDKMDVDRNDCFDPESWSLFPQTDDGENLNDSFAIGGEDYSYAAMATPPPSAKEPPANWSFAASKTDQGFFANPLHQLDTSQPINSRFDWGQPTPPDDQASPVSQFPTPSEDHIKQEPDLEQSKPVQRRKKSDESSNGATKRRRSRKSISTESTGSGPSADPVEEERRNRFLERNRVAASKCRQKKKEWTQNLESQARELHSNNHQLQVLVGSLKDEVMYLRGEMLKHATCDCTGIRDYLSREADFLASGGARTPASQAAGNRSRHSSAAASSPGSSIVSAIGSSNKIDPQLQHQMESSVKQKHFSKRAGSVDSESGTET